MKDELVKVKWLKEKSGHKVGDIVEVKKDLAKLLVKKKDCELINKKKKYNPQAEIEELFEKHNITISKTYEDVIKSDKIKPGILNLLHSKINEFIKLKKPVQIFDINGYVLEVRNEGVDAEVTEVINSYYDKSDLAQKIYEVQPYFYDSTKIWWIWNKKEFKWEIKDDKDVLIIVSECSNANTVNSKEKGEIIESMQQYGRKKLPKDIKPTWIQFKDTIIDFKTGEEFKAMPEYFVTNPIPWKLHSDKFENTPMMDKIFEEWVGKEHIQTLYEIIAYCLIPDYPIHRLFCFIGEGMNGKSCFLRLLKDFIGEDNVTATELDTLLNSRFEITKLHKKLVCIMGETNFTEMSKTSIIKKLTGQDTIGFEYKNKNPFDDINYAKILIATNNLPTTTDKTIGFYRRWMIIDFPNRFSEQKDILKDIPKEEYEALTRKSLKILRDLIEDKKFHKEGTIEERAKKYEDHSDPLEKFLKEYTEEEFGGSIWKFEFEKRLNEWCKSNRFRQLSEVVIGKKMKEKGIDQSQKSSTWLIDGTNKMLRAWSGIRWKEVYSQD